nr:hypothetical protein GCM10025732_12750 [Glycomyces mayteni]
MGVAQLSYAYIEEPVRNWHPLKRNAPGLLMGLTASLACAAAVLALLHVFPKTPGGTEPVDLARIEAADDLTAQEQRLRDGLETTALPADLLPPLAGMDGDRPATYDDGCHLDFDETEPPADCTYGDPGSDTIVLLYGDSHAAQWFPALDALADREGWALVSRTKSSCTPVEVHVGSTQSDGEYTECWDWKQRVQDEIADLRPDLVVFGSTDNSTPFGADDPERTWSEGWAAALGAAAEHAGAVAVLTDTPWATGEAAPECLALNPGAVQECVSEDPYALSHLDYRGLSLAAQADAGVTTIDTEPWFCVDGQCPLVVDDMAVYRDGHHVSTPYAASLATLLGDALPLPG